MGDHNQSKTSLISRILQTAASSLTALELMWVQTSGNLVTGLAVQAGGGDVAGPVGAAGGEQDEVTWESLVLPHHHHVPHLAAHRG